MEFKGKEVVKTPSVKRYEIGSQTKMFTALLAFKAKENGLLKLEDKVSQYVDAKFLVFNHEATGQTYDVSNNTIKDLITHQIKAPDMINYGKAVKDEEIFDILSNSSIDLDSDAGVLESIEKLNKATKEDINGAFYNNTGYWLLGKVVEKVYGSNIEQTFNENILKPLQMNDTNWDNSDVHGSAGGRTHRFSTKFYGPAGGLVSSYADMNKFMLGFSSLIKEETLKEWKALAISRPLGAGLINLKEAVKEKHNLPLNWWGHAGQTLQMQSGSFINDNNEVLLFSTDDALFNPFKIVFEELKK